MLWVLKRTISIRRFFWASKTYAKNYGQENIYYFSLIFCVHLNLFPVWSRFKKPLDFKDLILSELKHSEITFRRNSL